MGLPQYYWPSHHVLSIEDDAYDILAVGVARLPGLPILGRTEVTLLTAVCLHHAITAVRHFLTTKRATVCAQTRVSVLLSEVAVLLWTLHDLVAAVWAPMAVMSAPTVGAIIVRAYATTRRGHGTVTAIAFLTASDNPVAAAWVAYGPRG